MTPRTKIISSFVELKYTKEYLYSILECEEKLRDVCLSVNKSIKADDVSCKNIRKYIDIFILTT